MLIATRLTCLQCRALAPHAPPSTNTSWLTTPSFVRFVMDGSYINIANVGDLLPSDDWKRVRNGTTDSSATASKRSSSRGRTGAVGSPVSGVKSISSSGFISSSRPASRASSRRSSIEHLLHDDTPQRQAIREAVIKRDADELRRLSTKGFIHHAMRRLVWYARLSLLYCCSSSSSDTLYSDHLACGSHHS